MSDLGSEIFKIYGVAAIAFPLLAAVVVWILAHLAAAPGTEVSVLWGLVKYTKAPVAMTLENKPFRLTLGQIDSKTPTAKTLVVKNGVSDENRDDILQSLRNERHLRELTFVESGKEIQDLPPGTYSFLAARCLDTDTSKQIFGSSARYPNNPMYFEIQNTLDDGPHLIAYVNEVHAAAVSKLTGETAHDILAFPRPGVQMTSLVSIPFARVQNSKLRELQISQDVKVVAVDMTIQ
jgi:hypothetical protein